VTVVQHLAPVRLSNLFRGTSRHGSHKHKCSLCHVTDPLHDRTGTNPANTSSEENVFAVILKHFALFGSCPYFCVVIAPRVVALLIKSLGGDKGEDT
jgi:hypothetical protein